MQNQPQHHAITRLGSLLNTSPGPTAGGHAHPHCPVCHTQLIHEKCKVICRSAFCIYRIIYNCSEF